MSNKEDSSKRRRLGRERSARYRQNLSEEEQEIQHQQDARRMVTYRQHLSEEEQEIQHQQHAERMVTYRQRSREPKVAVSNSLAIMSGQLQILPFSIGLRTNCCEYCNAKLWNHEKKWKSICCSAGMVVVKKWEQRNMESTDEQEQFAGLIHDLWRQDSREAHLLKQFARPLNNALALASQVVDEGYHPLGQRSFRPNIVIRGQLFHKMGASLLPPPNTTPKFAQIYVYDPDQDEGAEANIRLGHMRLGSGVTEATRNELFLLLTKLQSWLHKCNSYIRDFVQVCKIPSQEVEDMHLVICPRVIKPIYDHAGDYNQPTGLREVQVLMCDSPTDQKHSIVIRKRPPNESEPMLLQQVSDIHRSFDPLHYPLLFPEGEDSWHTGMLLQSPPRQK